MTNISDKNMFRDQLETNYFDSQNFNN